MEHEFCCKCKRYKPDSVYTACNYADCAKWRKWFRTQWAGIRKAADNIRKQTKG